jgi:C_GCAxxG_C_C family probable redox protein
LKTSSAEEARKRAEQSFSSGLFCAESVVLAIAESQGVDSELLPRAASAFCGGMSRTGGTCGALTGAVMGVSMSLGRASADEPVQPAYTATQRLVEEFEREFGSRDCPSLLSGCDLNTAEGKEQFREQNLAQRCMRYSGKAAEIAVRVIADSKDSSSPREEGDEEQSSGCVCC